MAVILQHSRATNEPDAPAGAGNNKLALDISFLTLPGLMNSGPDHWQTHWEHQLPRCRRVNQTSWDRPFLADWLHGLEQELQTATAPVILIAHSLGCILAASLAAKPLADKVRGAFLVAPADVESTPTLACVRNFLPLPRHALPFPSLVAASSNDPYLSLDRAEFLADAWGSEFVNVGPAGHINTASGHGPWPEGMRLLTDFCERISTYGGQSPPYSMSGAGAGQRSMRP